MSNKIGFWSVLALVTGSQIGSGVFMLPASLAPYGNMAFGGWITSGIGAILLALVFAKLCALTPKTGGPHAYVLESFGITPSFFTAWTYWIISWVSTTAVIISCIGYLTPLIGHHGSYANLFLQLILLGGVTFLNLRGVQMAGKVEFILTNLKILPLVLIPFIGLFFFDSSNIVMASSEKSLSLLEGVSRTALLTLWGFIGLESATTPAGSVENPSKTIPRAVVIGTILVAFLYLFNSIGIMGSLSAEVLAKSHAPYVDVTRQILGSYKDWSLLISVLASIICLGTLNAWVLTSGQIALGAAQDKIFPSFFGKKNRFSSPSNSLILSSLGIIPFLFLTAQDNLAHQISDIIDLSVTAFLFVYLICIFSFIKGLISSGSLRSSDMIYALGALIFCLFVIINTSFQTIALACLFTLSGVPVYLFQRRNLKNS